MPVRLTSGLGDMESCLNYYGQGERKRKGRRCFGLCVGVGVVVVVVVVVILAGEDVVVILT